ncbi:VanZ family protein [Paenibacillus harenae]|uniref:VanZ family protein n=1 Tax=Paenibacillus harenae TaxID=306543 RepID=UPI00040817A0|nr:VanZ family protein [Paenibacillus harenae]
MKNNGRWLPPLLWGILLAAWLTLVFVFSSQSYEQQSIQPLLLRFFSFHDLVRWLPDITIKYQYTTVNSHSNPYKFIEFLFRKGAHLFVYATFAALFFMFVRSFNIRRVFRAILATLLVVIAVPAADEWNQLSSEHRTGNTTDVLLDFTGGCIGLSVCLLILALARVWKLLRK